MKRLKLTTLLLLLSMSSFAGDKGGNGGDATASEFSRLALRSYQAFNQSCTEHPEEPSCSLLEEYKDAVYHATITVKERVYASDGRERDAINNGYDEIEIGHLRWKKLNERKKLSIVIHEYLSLKGIEKSDRYAQSNSILFLMEQARWTVSAIFKDEPLTKTYKRYQAMILFRGELKYALAKPTNALGFCIRKGFKVPIQSSTIPYAWTNQVNISPDGETIEGAGNTTGSILFSIQCGF